MEIALCSKYVVVNVSRLAWGMGLRILGGFAAESGGGFALSDCCGMYRITGEWSEFKSRVWFVVDVNELWLGELI
jgi:hypothetical protein